MQDRVAGSSRGRVASFGIAKMLAAVIAAVAIILAVVPFFADVDGGLMRTAALTVFAIGFWATGVWPIGLTAVALFLFAVLFQIHPPALVFSGFASAALWLVFGGLVIGASVRHTGLGERIARGLVGRLGGSYLKVLSGLALVSLALGFVMPSTMGRVVLLVPIVTVLADRLGYAPGTKGRHGLILATAFMSFTSAGTILPALVPGLALAGLAETLYGIEITYAGFLQIHFPVLGLLKIVFTVLIAAWLFGEPPGEVVADEGQAPPSSPEKWLAWVLIVALVFWVTDFVHGISPAWVALAAALVILIPGSGMVGPRAFDRELDYGSVFYVSAVLGLSAMLSESGLAVVAGNWLFSILPFAQGADAVNYGALAILSSAMGLLVTNPGIPAVLSPLAQEIADVTGLPVMTVLMSQVIGFTNIILPYQASPLIVAMAMGKVPLGNGVKLALLSSLVGFAVLVPINYAWWKFLGLLG